MSRTGPGPRTFPAMAYDSVRRRVVLFGGNRVLFGRTVEDNVYLNDTWEWDGRSWSEIKVPGPPRRAEATMAFDSKLARIVLFGGHNRVGRERQRLGDTWEWDGKRWTQMNVSGPSPRNGAAAVYDSGRGKIVLFGGSTQEGVSDETWEWDGQQWERNSLASTQGRFNCVMAYDKTRHVTIRFGGRFSGNAFGDTWEYDGKSWTQLSTTGPIARNHTAMVYAERFKKIVLFGGHDLVNVFGDTWEWNGREWSQREGGETLKHIENGH